MPRSVFPKPDYNPYDAKTLAQMILKHPFVHAGMRPEQEKNFEETLLYSRELHDLRAHEVLTLIASGELLPAEKRKYLPSCLYALNDLKVFFKKTIELANDTLTSAGSIPSMTADEMIESLATPIVGYNLQMPGKAHESILDDRETLKNIADIESMMKALSQKPGFQMDDPRRGKSR